MTAETRLSRFAERVGSALGRAHNAFDAADPSVRKAAVGTALAASYGAALVAGVRVNKALGQPWYGLGVAQYLVSRALSAARRD